MLKAYSTINLIDFVYCARAHMSNIMPICLEAMSCVFLFWSFNFIKISFFMRYIFVVTGRHLTYWYHIWSVTIRNLLLSCWIAICVLHSDIHSIFNEFHNMTEIFRIEIEPYSIFHSNCLFVAYSFRKSHLPKKKKNNARDMWISMQLRIFCQMGSSSKIGQYYCCSKRWNAKC